MVCCQDGMYSTSLQLTVIGRVHRRVQDRDTIYETVTTLAAAPQWRSNSLNQRRVCQPFPTYFKSFNCHPSTFLQPTWTTRCEATTIASLPVRIQSSSLKRTNERTKSLKMGEHPQACASMNAFKADKISMLTFFRHGDDLWDAVPLRFFFFSLLFKSIWIFFETTF